MSTTDKSKNTEVVEDIKDEQVQNETSVNEETPIDPIEAVKDELQKEKDRYLRLFAEFENYKKRTSKERIELFKTAGEEVIVSLLPVLDDFDRALKEVAKEEDAGHLKGFELISNKLRESLRSKGMQLIETKQGETFNADDHEAVTQIPAPSKKLKGKIIDVIEKGYKLGDKVIRFPKVVIGQ